MKVLYPEYKDPAYTYFDTFTFQGKEYLLHTSVTFKKKGLSKNACLIQLVESYLDEFGTHYWTYVLWNRSGHYHAYTTYHLPDEIIESIIEEAKLDSVQEKKPEYYKDSEVKVVVYGWIIYIAAMFGSFIFRDAIVLWVFGSVFFFAWRKEKLKKPVEHNFGFNFEEKVREWNERKT